MEVDLPSPAESRPVRSASYGGEAQHPTEFVDPGPRQDVLLSETIPLAAQSPPRRAMSHTPPLLPAHSVENDACRVVAVNPLLEFSVTTRHTVACDRCLAAACSLLHFDIAEVFKQLISWCLCERSRGVGGVVLYSVPTVFYGSYTQT